MDLKLDYPNIRFAGNGKLKLLIIVGTRPEIIRLAAVINKCRMYFDCILAHTGQNYDYNLNGIFFRDLKLKEPEVYLNAVGDDLGATMGNIINASYKLMVQTAPRCGARSGRHQLVSVGHQCQTTAHPDFFTWRPATVARTNVCPKKPIAESWTSSPT